MVTLSRAEVDELIREDPENFRVHRRLYTDPAIFDLELEQIFYRTWVYIAHESEVAQGGDYKTTCIGRQPVIVTRDPDDGQVYVLYNRCRHRGATVCQYEYGTSTYFRCAYHSWTYNNRGELVGVPFPKGYGDSFDIREFGLVQVPRVANYRGLLFASLSPDGPSLEEHLGNARPYLDIIVEQGPAGIAVRSGAHKYGFNGNWKLQLENSVDDYHFTFLHESQARIMERRTGQRPNPSAIPAAKTRDLGNGHGLLDFGRPTGTGVVNDVPFNLTIFPNLAFVGFQFRVIRPVAVDRTEVALYPMLLKGVAPEVNAKRLRLHELFFGPAGFGGPDDVEALARVQEGLQVAATDWVLLSRGLSRQEVDERGVRTSHITDELPQQAIYRQWKRLMAVE